MKLYVKMQASWAALRNRKGQNTVEYLLMLAVIVGVALAVGKGFQTFFPEIFDSVKQKILGGIGQMGGGGGN